MPFKKNTNTTSARAGSLQPARASKRTIKTGSVALSADVSEADQEKNRVEEPSFEKKQDDASESESDPTSDGRNGSVYDDDESGDSTSSSENSTDFFQPKSAKKPKKNLFAELKNAGSVSVVKPKVLKVKFYIIYYIKPIIFPIISKDYVYKRVHICLILLKINFNLII